MALTPKQHASFANVEGLPILKIICIAKAAYKLYNCIKAAKGDVQKILQCVGTFVSDVETCLKSK